MTPQDENQGAAARRSAPKAVISRLSLYLRELQRLAREGRETISSGELGRLLGSSDAQVRKDLAYFGQFGYPGVGYRTGELATAIREILSTDRTWSVAIVGIGNLGRALMGYKGFSPQGFEIAAAFDAAAEKVGIPVEGVPVLGMEELPRVVKEQNVRLGVIAVPAEAAQGVADQLVTAGVRGILNFAPVTLSVPDSVNLVGVDMAIELEQLAFAVVNRTEGR